MSYDPGALLEYQSQLEQVTAALQVDPENDDLKTLKTDLEEVIALSVELVTTTAPQISSKTDLEKASSSSLPVPTIDKDTGLLQFIGGHKWTEGDQCMCLWSEDGKYYKAVIDEILTDASCTVTFIGYEQSENARIADLKTLAEYKIIQSEKKDLQEAKKKKKDQYTAQQEYKKRRSQKKAQRLKQLEDERETDKQKWKSFSIKTNKSFKNRIPRKEINRRPDKETGIPVKKTGVGPQLSAGRREARFVLPEKYRKT